MSVKGDNRPAATGGPRSELSGGHREAPITDVDNYLVLCNHTCCTMPPRCLMTEMREEPADCGGEPRLVFGAGKKRLFDRTVFG